MCLYEISWTIRLPFQTLITTPWLSHISELNLYMFAKIIINRKSLSVMSLNPVDWKELKSLQKNKGTNQNKKHASDQLMMRIGSRLPWQLLVCSCWGDDVDFVDDKNDPGANAGHTRFASGKCYWQSSQNSPVIFQDPRDAHRLGVDCETDHSTQPQHSGETYFTNVALKLRIQ